MNRRLVLVTAVLAALNLVAGGVVVVLQALDSTSAVDVAESVDRFRAGQAMAPAPPIETLATVPSTTTVAPPGPTVPAPTGPAGLDGPAGATSTTAVAAPTTSAPPAGRAPAEGVYVYETTGSEEIDLMGGAEHTYPPETTVTVVANDCGGNDLRWDALDERWDLWRTCAGPDGEVVAGFTSYHKFFGVEDRRDFIFDPTYLWWPRDDNAVWTYSGSAGATTSVGRGEVIGRQAVVVAGQTIDALYLRIVQDQGGDSSGQLVRETWLHPETGLVLRLTWDGETSSTSALGPVDHRESYEIHLTSLVPLT